MTGQVFEFAQMIIDSGLMTAAEVEAFIQTLPVQAKPRDANGLAQALVREKKLTPYQAQAVYLGKGSQLTLGNYVILGKLGKGGMGVVYKALHRWMDRVVAIKVLSRAAVKVPALAKRFKREVRAAALLEHPNIVTAYDADEAGGRLFLVMQYVEGTDLSSLVKDRGPLPVSMAISCLRQAARGLEYAHSRRVVHRDIKPSNLMLGKDGTLRILDMGLARVEALGAGSQDTELTDTGVVMGSVDFMAPEQAADMRKSDARSDIYSLGYTLWYLLTGREAYPAASPMEKLIAHWERPLPSLREVRPEISPSLEAIFHKMVAKQPADRYQNMTEVITDLERAWTTEAAAASHAPADEERRQDQELAEFLQVLADQRAEANPEFGRSGNRGRGPASSSLRSREDTAPRGSSTLRSRGATRRPRRYLTRRNAAWLGMIGMVAVLVTAGVVGSSRDPADPGITGGEGPREKKPESSGPSAPEPGNNCVSLLDAEMSSWKTNAAWRVQKEGKALVLKGSGRPSDWLQSKRTDYGAFTLWLDYRLPEKGVDSGLFVHGKFTEIQIRDDQDPRLGSGRSQELTGAVVDRVPVGLPISLDPAYARHDWHTMVVQVQADNRIRVWIDDQLVTDSQGGLLMSSSGCIGLEAGSLEATPKEIWFRNIKIEEAGSGTKPQAGTDRKPRQGAP